MIDVSELTLDELEQVETMSGFTMDQLVKGAFTRPRALKALRWIEARRTNPNADFNDFGNVTLESVLGSFGDEDPKELSDSNK
jgi:hypothetical protein